MLVFVLDQIVLLAFLSLHSVASHFNGLKWAEGREGGHFYRFSLAHRVCPVEYLAELCRWQNHIQILSTYPTCWQPRCRLTCTGRRWIWRCLGSRQLLQLFSRCSWWLPRAWLPNLQINRVRSRWCQRATKHCLKNLRSSPRPSSCRWRRWHHCPTLQSDQPQYTTTVFPNFKTIYRNDIPLGWCEVEIDLLYVTRVYWGHIVSSIVPCWRSS